VGGDAVEYVDPRDVQSILAALRRVLTDEARRDHLRRAGLVRAAGFSWASFSEHTIKALEAAAATQSQHR
jgi:glycosyltransferase involved in cell wall biosynthesis